MPLYRATRAEVLAALADEFLHNYGRGRASFAVDGGPATDPAGFARDLADVLRSDARGAYAASLADFPGADPATADDALLRETLVQPFRKAGQPFALTPGGAEIADAPADAVLVVAGDGAQTPALRGLWNAVVYLSNPGHRVEADDASADEAERAHARYARDVGPRRAATMIVEVADPDFPRRIFADSC